MYQGFIRDAIESASNYYEYVQKTKSSRTVVTVESVAHLSDNLFVLTLDRRLKNADSSVLCIESLAIPDALYYDRDNHFIGGDFYHIVKTSDNGGSVTLSLEEELLAVFEDVPPKSISFVSDLSFLIERVEKWYWKYGYNIQYPKKPSILPEQIYKGITESREQTKAIKTALSNPISYIWGAPGTGKTQIVLAHCIMSYLLQEESDSQILILAPTNNALEQTLRSVINALIELGQNIDCLYRLGAPSESFAAKFGKICRRLDQEARCDALAQEIAGLKKKKQFSDRAQSLSASYQAFYDLKKRYEALKKQELDIPAQIVELEAGVHHLESSISSLEKKKKDIPAKIKQLTAKESSALFRLKKFFDKSSKTVLIELQAQKASLESEESKLEQRILDSKIRLKQKQEELNAAKEELRHLSSSFAPLAEQLREIASEALGRFSSIEGASLEFAQLIADIKNDIVPDIADRISEKEVLLEQERKKIEEDLQKKRVFALTVDHFFSHYEELSQIGLSSARLAHIFLDEAAYCPLIKAGILFSIGVPVTLLGDHMQLLPICEANEKELIDGREDKIFLWALSAIHFPQIFERFCSVDDLFSRFAYTTGAKILFTDELTAPSDSQYYSDKKLKTAILTKTYRFGCELAKILDTFVYHNNFKGNPDVKSKIVVLDAPKNPVAGASRTSMGEVEVIRSYIKENRLTDFSVLTPYKKQRDLLQKEIPEIDQDDVMTIHASQGREWETVIISIVDSSEKDLHFTNSRKIESLHLLNTAISRAKKNIVIVCNLDFWKTRNRTQLIGQLVNPLPLSDYSPNEASAVKPAPAKPSRSKHSRKKSAAPKQIKISWSQEKRELYKRGVEVGHLENAVEQKTQSKFISKIQISQHNKLEACVLVAAETQKEADAYKTTLHSCTCKSFQFPPGRVPAACKHMFALALSLKVITKNGKLNDTITIPSRNVIKLP